MPEKSLENSIEAFDLTKKFGQFVAVNKVSFSVKKGEIFGFLGANGAGKSTTIRMLCGLLRPSSGRAKVGGFDTATQSEKVKESIGYMSQKFSLYEDLTVEENIRFFGGIYGMSRLQIKAKMSWALDLAGLGARKKSLARELSVGWRQRLALGCAFLHEPRIVFLDEPTGGVDPVSRRNFWELISQLSESGVTVFVTTHYLDEAEYCHRVMLIHAGALIAGGSPGHLKKTYLGHPILEVECDEVIKALEIMQQEDWVIEISVFGTYLHVSVPDEAEGRSRIASLLLKHNIIAKRVDRIMPSLEDVFLHLIEEKTQPEKTKALGVENA